MSLNRREMLLSMAGGLAARWLRSPERAKDGAEPAGGARPLRRADDQVRDDAALVQSAQHADLNRPEAGAPREDKRDAIRGRTHTRWASLAGMFLRQTSAARLNPGVSPRKNRPGWRREEK